LKIKNKYYTTQEAGEILGLSTDHTRRLILEGKLKAEKKGWSWLILEENLKHYKNMRLLKTVSEKKWKKEWKDKWKRVDKP
jgi:excisionase family DNA binding protein